MAPKKGAPAQPALAKLDWTEKLVQSGKNASNDAMQRRLKTLHEKLKGLDQDAVDIRSLQGIKKELLHTSLMHNKDKGVKAYTACCQADLLRLYAPDAPYTESELRDIFSFMATQLKNNLKPLLSNNKDLPSTSTSAAAALGSGSGGGRVMELPFYGEYAYLLDSLAQIRSICLVPDLPQGDELVVQWFESLFMGLRIDMPRSLVSNIELVLQALIEESDTVPEDVVRKLLQQLEDYSERPEHPGFTVAANVIKATSQKLQRYILTYFTDIQLAHARDPTPEDLKILTASHDLLLILFQHAPECLLNTLPQLQESLLSEELQLRVLTTSTLGRMFATSAVGFGGPQGFAAYWQSWMGRRADKAMQVRLAWVEATKSILENRLEMRIHLEGALREKFQDVDERVRAAMCKIFAQLDYEIALHNVDLTTLKMIGDRVMDKKFSVVEQAFETLGKLYNAAFSEIDADDSTAISQFAWIPNTIYHCVWNGQTTEIRALAEDITARYIVPLPSMPEGPRAADGPNEGIWVDRLLTVTKHLDARAFEAFMALSNLADPGMRPWEYYIQCCEANNGGIIDDNAKEKRMALSEISEFLAISFKNTPLAEQHLLEFADSNQKRLYTLLKANASEVSDLKTLVKNQAELLRRLKQNQASVMDTFIPFARKASRWIVNRSSISPLLERAARSQMDPAGMAARKILDYTAKWCPSLFKSHVAELQKSLMNNKSPHVVQVAMHALAQLVKQDPTSVSSDKKLADQALKLLTSGNEKGAKFSARYLIFSEGGKDCKAGLEIASKALRNGKDDSLLPSLRSLAEFAKSAPLTFRDQSDKVIPLAMDKVLMHQFEEEEEPRKWTEAEGLEPLEQAKLSAIRLFVAYCISVVEDDAASKLAEPYIKMLGTILDADGRVSGDTAESENLAAHMRLTAALGLMKMAAYRVYDKAIDEDLFEAIILVVQDTIFQIRVAFLKKYKKYLQQKKHSSRWTIIAFFTAHDPEPESVDISKRIFGDLSRSAKGAAKRKERLEKPFDRFLLALSRHPDFAEQSREDFKDMSEYIRLYIDNVVMKDNMSLLYHTAQRMMTVKDIRNPDSEAHVKIAELAQLMLQNHAHAQGWTIEDYTGHVSLSSTLYKKLSNPDEAAQIRKKTYLPEDIGDLLEEARVKTRPKKARKEPGPKKVTPQKRKASAKIRRSAKKGINQDEDEEEEDEEDEDDDDDEEETSDDDGMEVDESEEEEVDDGILGRGGKRAAKAKKRKPTARPHPRKRVKQAEDSGSELTDLDE